MSNLPSPQPPGVRSSAESGTAGSSLPVALHAASVPQPHIRGRSPEQLADLQSRARRLAGNPLLQQPAGTLLKRLAEAALSSLRELHRELRDSPHRTEAPAGAADAVGLSFRRTNAIFDTLEAQLGALETMSLSVTELSKVARGLLDRKSVTWSRLKAELQKLAGCCDETFRPLAVWPGFVTSELIGAQPGLLEIACLARGIQTARVLWHTLRSEILWADRMPMLLAAAMLQDIGMVHVNGLLSIEHPKGIRLKERLVAMHPLISAAAVGAVAGAPVELAAIIAQHHERCDGSGFPRRVGLNRIPPSARLLGAANRLVELGESGAVVGAAQTEAAQLGFALDRLASEADEGCWDLQFVRLIESRWRPLVTSETGIVAETASSLEGPVVGSFGGLAADDSDAALRLDRREADMFERHFTTESHSRRHGGASQWSVSRASIRHD